MSKRFLGEEKPSLLVSPPPSRTLRSPTGNMMINMVINDDHDGDGDGFEEAIAERGKAVTSAFIFVITITTISSLVHHSNNYLLVSPCFCNYKCHLVFKVVMVSTTAAIAKGEAGVLKAEMVMFNVFFFLFEKESCGIVCKEMPNIEGI